MSDSPVSDTGYLLDVQVVPDDEVGADDLPTPELLHDQDCGWALFVRESQLSSMFGLFTSATAQAA